MNTPTLHYWTVDRNGKLCPKGHGRKHAQAGDIVIDFDRNEAHRLVQGRNGLLRHVLIGSAQEAGVTLF